MATSYGSITITDRTDLGRLSVFLQGSTVNQQIYDGNNSTYYPNWNTNNGGTALLLIPYVYYDTGLVFNGEATNSQLSIEWSKIENGVNYGVIPKSPTTTECPEALNTYGCLNRPINLTPGSTGVVYTAKITYRPINGNNDLFLTAIATFDLSIAQYGIDGGSGAPGKTLQLNGTGSHFTYDYRSALFGAQTITMTAQVRNTAATSGVRWRCDNQTIYSDSNSKPTLTNTGTPYTSLSLQIAGDSNSSGVININTLSTNFSSNKYAQFEIIEMDTNGNELANGLTDYFNIYKYLEAAPGEGAYVSYLDNDEETIIEYDGEPQLNNAISRLYITHDGASDMDHWQINITDNIDNSSDFTYTTSNSRDTGNSTHYYDTFGPDTVVVTGMEVTTAMITFTAIHGSVENDHFVADGAVANLVNNFSLARSASIVSHSLRLDAVNANKAAAANTYTPATVIIDAVERTGGSGANPYRENGVIHAIVHLNNGISTLPGSLYNFGTTSNPVYYISNTTNNALSLTLANCGNIVYIETFLGGTYNSSTYTFDNAEDKQKITISSDGINGVDSWQVNLVNVFDGISTNTNNIAIDTATYEIPFEVFEGIIQKEVRYGGTTYPTVSAVSSNNAITLSYYNSGGANPNNPVNITGSVVDMVKFGVTGNSTNIGSEGTITFTFNLDGTNTIDKIYSYKAYPQALSAVNVQIYGTPSTTFTNQSGTIILEPVVTEGTTNISDSNAVSKYKWYIYDNGWKAISNTSTSDSTKYYSSAIKTGYYNGSNNFIASDNDGNNRTSKLLQIQGSAVDGYAYFKVEASVTVAGTNGIYTAYTPVTDIDDPIQVSLHSTLGEQLVNGQGAGVVYVRVTRDNIELDPIVPDNQLGIGQTAPSGTRNDGDFAGKLGYFVYNASTYILQYYHRNSISDSWVQRGTPADPYTCTYSWTFRNFNNEPIKSSDTGLAANIQSILQNNTSTQFFFLNRDVVDKKLSADVKVIVN